MPRPASSLHTATAKKELCDSYWRAGASQPTGTNFHWRAGASLPSRPNGAIFLFIYIYPALMYAVMFYVILNKRKLH